MSAPQRLDSKGIVVEDADGRPLLLNTVESILEIWLDGGNGYAVETVGHWLGYGADPQPPSILADVERSRKLAERRRYERERKRKYREKKKRGG